MQSKFNFTCDTNGVSIKLNCNSVELLYALNELFKRICNQQDKDTALKLWLGSLLEDLQDQNKIDLVKSFINDFLDADTETITS